MRLESAKLHQRELQDCQGRQIGRGAQGVMEITAPRYATTRLRVGQPTYPAGADL
jgi:hypothetical protein